VGSVAVWMVWLSSCGRLRPGLGLQCAGSPESLVGNSGRRRMFVSDRGKQRLVRRWEMAQCEGLWSS
jgi:hypothetical protein